MNTDSKRLTASQWAGAIILGTLATFALLEWLLFDRNPAQQQLDAVLALPSLEEPLGTDQFGRSMLARMGAAVRLSFALGLLCVMTSALVGVLLGVWAAWRGGWADRLMDILLNTLLALPGLVLVLLLVALVPGSFAMLYFAISMVLWVEYYRVARAVTLTVVTGPQMQASKLLGFGRWYLFRRHIWPTVAPPVLALSAFGAGNAILALASLGFIYVGLRPPTAELGLMMVELFPYYSEAPGSSLSRW
ncbi:ABC transporter permease [Marinobacterium aestuariivivens]|uniref:ABC transporter permease n=1 Tax=Marinobacterium aestuariivivens TaxID=1698799 RepID=A0ABW2A7G3_9GAMM